MRKQIDPRLEAGRIRDDGQWGSDPWDGFNGAFVIEGPAPMWMRLRIVASDGTDPTAQGWEHVSVSTQNRCPNWPEMCFVKDLFWSEEEAVVQFHPPKSQYVSYHPFTLHLWRNPRVALELPPTILVGPLGIERVA
jgi:hypothetical protein